MKLAPAPNASIGETTFSSRVPASRARGFQRGHIRAMAVCALVALLAGCGGGGGDAATPTQNAAATPVVSSGTWAVIGSSSAAGVGAQTRSWVQIVGSTYSSASVQVTNLAVQATTTYAGLPTTASVPAGRPTPSPSTNIDAALSLNPKVVLVSYPTNDTRNNYSTDETVANLMAIRAAATARGVPVIMLSTQPRNLTSAQLAQLQDIDTRLSALTAPCFVAVRAALAGSDGWLAPAYDAGDGIHPNDAGHAVIASKVVSLIDSGSCVTVK